MADRGAPFETTLAELTAATPTPIDLPHNAKKTPRVRATLPVRAWNVLDRTVRKVMR